MKLGIRKKMKKGKEKRRKITLKRGKGLKNASDWAINSKKIAGLPTPIHPHGRRQTYLAGNKN